MKPIKLILSRTSERIEQCGSRFWGNPDLPTGYEYPAYLDDTGEPIEYQFVCQINMGEIAPYDIENILPHKGLLSFFAKIDHYLGDYDVKSSISGYVSSPEDVRVLFFPDVGQPGECAGFDEMILVDDDDREINPRELTIDFTIRPSDQTEDIHALLADPIYREWSEWEHPYDDWITILQVDSFSGEDFNLNFMDVGVLDFIISPEDLLSCRFDRVRAIVLSS